MDMVRIKSHLILLLTMALVPFLFSGCEQDYIAVNNQYYMDGGQGTSETTGALVFKVNVKGIFNDFDRAEFKVFPGGGTRTLNRAGRHDVPFENLAPGVYDYTIIEWLWESGISTATGVTFNSGGWSTSTSTYYSSPYYEREYLEGSVTIEAGRTLFIDIQF